MTEELKKAIELLTMKAEHYDKEVMGFDLNKVKRNSEQTDAAVALIESALSTDKTLEVVKRKAKKVVLKISRLGWHIPFCPSCDKNVMSNEDYTFAYCPHCGEKLDWHVDVSEIEGGK